MKGSVYFCDQLTLPWSLEFDNPRSASFHLVRSGACGLESGKDAAKLAAGDLVFVEPGRRHTLSGLMATGDQTVLLCGYFDISEEFGTPLSNVFPSLSVVRKRELDSRPWLKDSLAQLGAEYLSRAPGGELIVDRLTEIVLIELIRIDFGRQGMSRFVEALADRQVSQALQQLHNNPHLHWTIASLASKVAMSRAAFAKRFGEMVGVPVFEYLTQLRMRRARALLRDTRLPIFDIARRVGYDSDLAFTRTFTRQIGTTPTRYRKSADPAT